MILIISTYNLLIVAKFSFSLLSTCATGGAGTVYRSGVPEFTPCFSEVCVTRSLVLCVMFCRSLFVPLSFFLLAIVLSVLRFTDSDYSFGIFKLFLVKICVCAYTSRFCMYTKGIRNRHNRSEIL